MQIRITKHLSTEREIYDLLEGIHELSQLITENFDNSQGYLKNLLTELKWQMENEYADIIHHEYQKYSTNELKEMCSSEKAKNGETAYYNELDFEIYQREIRRVPTFVKKALSDYAAE